jgi:hypothetical protein
MNDAERKLVEDLEWEDEEYRLVRETVGEDLFRVRLVHRQTQKRLSVPGRFHTRVTAARAASLHLAALREAVPMPEPADDLDLEQDADEEYAVLHIGDWHSGKRETGPETFRLRVARIRDRLIKLRRERLRSYRLSGMMLVITGDMADGQGIYDTQQYNQAIPDGRHQAYLAAELVAGMVEDLAAYYGPVRVALVPGNHGIVRHAPISQNYDIVFGDRLATLLAGKAEVIYDRTDNGWLLRVEVVNGLYALLYHGHKKLGKTRVTAEKDIARWSTIQHLAPFHYVFCGHYHYVEYWEFNGIQFFRTGTMLTDDPYSRELGYDSSVRAWLFGIDPTHPERRITWQFQVDLT